MTEEKNQKDTKKKARTKSNVKLSEKLQKIVDQIGKLTALELADLVKTLEEKFGVSAAAPVAITSPAATSEEKAAGAPAEEKSEFNVVLAAPGANKIAVIKAVREIKPDLGLKEAKDLVEATPKTLVEAAKKEEAEAAKKKLEEAGAQVELK